MSNYTDPVTKAELQTELRALRGEIAGLKSNMNERLWMLIATILFIGIAVIGNQIDIGRLSHATAATKAAVRFPQDRR